MTVPMNTDVLEMGELRVSDVAVASTPKDTVMRDGTASLYHFRAAPEVSAQANIPFLLVPSMINRWYVLDLYPGASMCQAMVEHGLDTWLHDWGIPNPEDRYMTWEEILKRLDRSVRRVKRETGADEIAMLGYCMGGTLSTIYTALHPQHIGAYVNLTAPIDFSKGGMLRKLVDPEWFDPVAMTADGNLSPDQMESGFTALGPTGKLSKWVTLFDRWTRPGFRDQFQAMETWANDNIAFPGQAYRTYIGELYQQNLLYKGEHYVGGTRVDLSRIDCSLLTVVASRDGICPPDAATVLNDLSSSEDQEVFTMPGGHVGSVVGSKAPRMLYPKIAQWLIERYPITSSQTEAEE